MIPRLYDENETTFTNNGIGGLNEAISCTVNESLNGVYELELSYPITGRLFSSLANSRQIVATPYEGANDQAFRIYKITKPLNGRVTVYAQHISYQLNWIPVMPFNYSSLADCFAKLKTYSATTNPFTLWTNKSVANGHSFDIPQSFRACLGGTQGSVLQMYGGDYEWDNYTVKLWLRRGADNGVRIAYGKNLVDAKQEANIEETYTGVCPYWLDEETGTLVTLPEKYILAETAGSYPYSRIKTVDFSSDFEGEPTVAQLRARTNQYIIANNIGYPKISIDVNFVALWQSEEYKNIAPLEQVQLGDTVTVDIDRLGISMQSRVVEYTYDVLKDRYKSVVIGDAKSSFAKTFVDQGKAIETSLGEAKAYTGKAVAAAKSYATSYTDSEVDQAIEEAEATAQELMENATNWLTSSGGYVVAVKNTDGSWKELLFLDTPSTTTAQKVLRINENGMGFSANGVNGPYRQAWTLDGRLVVGGTNEVTISAYDASQKQIFGVDKTGIMWILQSSIMTKNGTLYFLENGASASSGRVLRINSGGISFGRSGYNGSFTQAWDMNGKLMIGGTDYVQISATDGTKEIFNVSKGGISWTMAQSIMQKNGTLYFLESGATASRGRVMRMNNGGIAFSKNGYNGTFTQAWNIGGQLTVGGSDVVTIKATDSTGKDIFNVNKDGISWTSAQSIMQKNGTLYFLGSGATATSGNVMRLNNLGISFSKNGYQGTYTQSWTIGGSLTLGGSNDQYGKLTVLDSNGNTAMTLSKDDIEFKFMDQTGEQYGEAYLNENGLDFSLEDDGDTHYANYGPNGAFMSSGSDDYVAEITPGSIAVGTEWGSYDVWMHIDGDSNGHIETDVLDVRSGGEAHLDTLYLGGKRCQRFSGGATDDFFVGGQHLYFVNGVLDTVEDT